MTETALIDIEKLGKVFEFSNKTKQIRDHYELYDPIKGRILGIADREINIKTTWDPATYNTGTNSNINTPWAENHVGEIWWDLIGSQVVMVRARHTGIQTQSLGTDVPGIQHRHLRMDRIEIATK